MVLFDNYNNWCYTNIVKTKISLGGENMKEAAGEANMTVVTIILIGIIVAVATPLIRNMMNSTNAKATCMNEGGCWVNGACDPSCSGEK